MRLALPISPLAAEVAHLLIAVAVTFGVFWAFAWSYPPGATTIRVIGGATTAIAAFLQVPPILRASRRA